MGRRAGDGDGKHIFVSGRFLLHEAIVHGGPVLEHVGEDPGFGFGVGGGVGLRPAVSAA